MTFPPVAREALLARQKQLEIRTLVAKRERYRKMVLDAGKTGTPPGTDIQHFYARGVVDFSFDAS